MSNESDDVIDLRPAIIGKKIRYYVDFNAKQTATDFLKGLDLDLPLRILSLEQDHSDNYWKKQGAMFKRQQYYHSLEIMFSMLISAIQCPLYPMAWLLSYTNHDLRDAVKSVSRHEPIPVLIKPSDIGWIGIVKAILGGSQLKDHHNYLDICKQQSRMLATLSGDILNEANIGEYNAIKHGFRVQQTGMKFSLFKEDQEGNPTRENPILGTESGNGSHFPVNECIDKDRNLWRVSFKSVPWDDKAVISRTKFAMMWAKNARAFMMAQITKEDHELFLPDDNIIKDAEYRHGPITNWHFRSTIDSRDIYGDIPPIHIDDEIYTWPSKEQISQYYSRRNR